MKKKITSLGNHACNALMVTPTQCLQDCLENDIGKRGAFKKGKKMIILVLDDTEGCYITNFTQAGLKFSEIVSLLELMKSHIKVEMGY